MPKTIVYSPREGVLVVKQEHPGMLYLYNISGKLVKVVQLGEGETTIYSLPSGLIIGNAVTSGNRETIKTIIK